MGARAGGCCCGGHRCRHEQGLAGGGARPGCQGVARWEAIAKESAMIRSVALSMSSSLARVAPWVAPPWRLWVPPWVAPWVLFVPRALGGALGVAGAALGAAEGVAGAADGAALDVVGAALRAALGVGPAGLGAALDVVGAALDAALGVLPTPDLGAAQHVARAALGAVLDVVGAALRRGLGVAGTALGVAGAALGAALKVADLDVVAVAVPGVGDVADPAAVVEDHVDLRGGTGSVRSAADAWLAVVPVHAMAAARDRVA
ncbi:hypothetical protein EDD94_7795 [Streptomyces sp. PanSC9]|nr:hypothetical protein EDD94_7795 [Streptomyces sp. PanSC9]